MREPDMEAVNGALSREVQKLQEELKKADRRAAILHMALVAADAKMRAGNMNAGCQIVRAALEGDTHG